MVAITLRIEPIGAQDLAWLRETVDDLHEIYQFLLLAEVADGVIGSTSRRMNEPDLTAAVTGQAIQVGTPLVRLNSGSLVLELSQFLDSTTGVQVLVGLGLLLKKGPEVAAWPNHLRKSWFESRAEAEKARAAYVRLSERSAVTVVEDTPSDAVGLDEVEETAAKTATPQVPRRTRSPRR